jgi:hypothetical protein
MPDRQYHYGVDQENVLAEQDALSKLRPMALA